MDEHSREQAASCVRTFFADERVVPVVGIVRVAKSSMRIFEFEKLVAVLSRVSRAFLYIWGRRRAVHERERERDEVYGRSVGRSAPLRHVLAMKEREQCVLVSVRGTNVRNRESRI